MRPPALPEAPRASAVLGGCALLLVLVLLASPAVRAGPVDSLKEHIDSVKEHVREAAHKVADDARRVRASVAHHAHAAASAVRRKLHRSDEDS
jgi:hypothetical protein